VIVSALICGLSDHVWLPHRLRVASAVSDRVFVLLDRCPKGEEACRRFPKVSARQWTPTQESFPMARDGATWDEGAMRQAVWDWAVECNPQYVLLGDTDEVPSPHITQWLLEGMG